MFHRYVWGVGTLPGKDDILAFHNLTRTEKSSCSSVTLKHNSTYYSTTLSYNNALNSKASNSSSNGGKTYRFVDVYFDTDSSIFLCAANRSKAKTLVFRVRMLFCISVFVVI